MRSAVPERVAPGRLPQHDDGVEEPQDGTDPDVDDGAGVDAAHDRHDHREEGGFPPPAPAQGDDGEAQHDGQAGPGEEDHRDAPRVLEEVRGEHVGQRGGGRPRAAQPENPREVEDTEAGGEEDGAEPQALGHPDRYVEQVEDREERPHRQQVADVLVAHRAEADRRVPHERDLAEEPGRVEVEVGLRVRRDDARPHRQQRGVGEAGQDGRAPDPPPAPPDSPAPPPVSGPDPFRPPGGMPRPGDGGGGGRGHGEPGRSTGSVSRQRHPGVSCDGRRPWPPAPRAA